MHIICTICSDIVNQSESIFVTKCGHLFHHHCLSQWIERSKTCPQCRNKVTDKCMFRVYPTAPEAGGGEDAPALQSRLDDAALQLRQLRRQQQDQEDKVKETQAALQKAEKMIKENEKKLLSRESAVVALREQLEYARVQSREAARLRDDNDTLTRTLQTLHGLQTVLSATTAEVEQMLAGYTDLRTLATFTVALKRALCDSESKKKESRDRLQRARTQLAAERSRARCLDEQIKQLKDQLELLAQPPPPAEPRAAKRRSSAEGAEGGAEGGAEHGARKLARPAGEPAAGADISVGSLAARIESGASPYLALRQGSAALAALRQGSGLAHPTSHKPPPGAASIFHRGGARARGYFSGAAPALDESFDGMGGHSKEDKFPTPTPRPLKPLVPKLSARPRLKRPAGTPSVKDLLNRSR